MNKLLEHIRARLRPVKPVPSVTVPAPAVPARIATLAELRIAEAAIAERQAEFRQWYAEWLETKSEHTPEALLEYFQLRLCVVFGEVSKP